MIESYPPNVQKGLSYIYAWLKREMKVDGDSARKVVMMLGLLWDKIGDRPDDHQDPKHIWLGMGEHRGRKGDLFAFASMEIDIQGAFFEDAQDALLARRIRELLNTEPKRCAFYNVTRLFRVCMLSGLHMDQFKLKKDPDKLKNQLVM